MASPRLSSGCPAATPGALRSPSCSWRCRDLDCRALAGGFWGGGRRSCLCGTLGLRRSEQRTGCSRLFLSSCLGVPIPFAEGAPRETEALGARGFLQALSSDGKVRSSPNRCGWPSDTRRAASYLPPASRRGLRSAGRGLGPGRGRSADPLFLGGRTPSASQEPQCQLFQAVVPGFEISLRLYCGFCTCLEVKIKTRLGKVSEGQGSCEKPDEFLSWTEIFPLTCLTCYIIQTISKSEYLVS